MKRQTIGLGSSSEESEQNQSKETKRLKVFHDPEHLSNNGEFETGSGSDTTEEYINFNGHDKSSKVSKTKEEKSFNQQSENNSLHNTHTNGSYTNNENNAEDAISVNNHLNGMHTGSGTYLVDQMKDRVPVSADHGFSVEGAQNFSLVSDASTIIYACDESSLNLKFNEGLPSEACDQFKSSQTNLVSDVQPSIQTEDTTTQHPEFNPQDSGNVQNDINEEELCDVATSTASSQGLLDEKSKRANDVSISFNEQAEPSTSGRQENDSQSVGTKFEPSSQVKVDVENITLCELKTTQLHGHADVVYCVDADEDFVLSSSGDTTVKVWNVARGNEISNFAGHNASVTSVILLNAEQSESLRSKLNCFQTSRIAVSASYDCHIRLWSVMDGQEILSMYTFNSITCMGYLENQMYVVVGTEGGKLEVWDLHLAKLVHFEYAHDSSVTNLKVHDCYVYSTSKDGAVKVWLFDDGELQPLYTRRRKETTSVASHFGPTQWQAIGVYNDMLFLGDNTHSLKALDWRLGRLRLFVNQPDDDGICEAVLAKNNILLTTFFNASSDTGGINVWRLPELAYVGTLTGDLQEICSLAMTQTEDRLRIVSGGHQLLVWDFDFTKPPIKTSDDPFFVCEVDQVGLEVNEESIETFPKKRLESSSSMENAEKKKSWCNIS